MNKYKVQQFDANGHMLNEEQVVATSYNAALHQLSEVAKGTWRLEVRDEEGNKVGGGTAEYWRRQRKSR